MAHQTAGDGIVVIADGDVEFAFVAFAETGEIIGHQRIANGLFGLCIRDVAQNEIHVHLPGPPGGGRFPFSVPRLEAP